MRGFCSIWRRSSVGTPGGRRDRAWCWTCCAPLPSFRPQRCWRPDAGWGTNLARLEHAGYSVTGLDVSREALRMIDRADRRLIEADLSQSLPEEVPEFDCVLALDVIEHIDDDAHALRQLARLVRPGGHLVITVPALPQLYSEFDAVQGHRRRYTADTLHACIADAELMLERTLWWGQWMVRLFGPLRHRDRARPGETKSDIYKRYLSVPPWPASAMLQMAFRLDHRRTLAGRNVTGTSLVAVATRPNARDERHRRDTPQAAVHALASVLN